MRKIIGLFLLIITFSSCISRYFQQKYYKDYYDPIKIQKQDYTTPKVAFIEGLTCFSYETPYCQSASLQIIHSLHTDYQSIDYYNWIMGFAYGAYFHNYVGVWSFIPANDPELGLKRAGNHLGLKRKYYTTNSLNIYSQFLKHLLSNNYPLRIAVNSNIIQGVEGFLPHSIILVGYDEDSIFYYETGGEDRIIKEHKGEKMDWETFFASVESVSKNYSYPWKYQATKFDLNELLHFKLNDSIIERINSQLLIGAKYGPVSTGGNAFLGLANHIETKGISENGKLWLMESFKLGNKSRYDNYMFLINNFTGSEKHSKVAELMRESSVLFERSIQLIEEKKIKELNETIKMIGEIEKRAGEELISNDMKN